MSPCTVFLWSIKWNPISVIDQMISSDRRVETEMMGSSANKAVELGRYRLWPHVGLRTFCVSNRTSDCRLRSGLFLTCQSRSGALWTWQTLKEFRRTSQNRRPHTSSPPRWCCHRDVRSSDVLRPDIRLFVAGGQRFYSPESWGEPKQEHGSVTTRSQTGEKPYSCELCQRATDW